MIGRIDRTGGVEETHRFELQGDRSGLSFAQSNKKSSLDDKLRVFEPPNRDAMLSTLLILAILAAIAWPYYTVYRLDRALALNDRQELEKLLDLEAIRRQLRQVLDQNIEGMVERYDNLLFKFLRGGVKEVGGTAYDALDDDWFRDTVLTAQRRSNSRRSLLGGFSFACFERPTRFLIRAGDLGKNPVHLYMTLKHWRWRVTAVFV